jgi:hypothetical protein
LSLNLATFINNEEPMRIREIFDTQVEEKIDPVVKVAERQDETKLAAEIGSYVVTPTIEKHLDDFLEHYTDTYHLPTTETGIWISGYFGSGKSYLAKISALLVENRSLLGVTAADRFFARVPSHAPHRNSIQRSLSRLDQCTTQLIGFNINTVADDKTTPLPQILLSQYYQAKGYSSNFIYARVIEAELDKMGRLADLHAAAAQHAGRPWPDIQQNLTFYARALYQAACEVAPTLFATTAAVAQALKQAEQGELYNVQFLVRTILDDLIARQQATGKLTRIAFVLDETGQWINDDNNRLSQLQALIEEAGDKGQGKIWLFVTTHEDMGAIYKNARARQADFKKVEGRFRFKLSLTTENIEQVLEDRLFKKNVAGRQAVTAVYQSNPGVLRDLGELKNSNQKLPPCSEEKFTTFYPFLPYQIHLIPEIVKSLRSAGGRGEQLSGSTRTLLAITQDILRAGRRPFLAESVGALVSFDEVYANLVAEGEIAPDVRREISRIDEVVPQAVPLTSQIAEVLYLVRELRYIPRTIDNVARLLVHDTDDDLSSLISQIQPELDKLQKARLVARIGEEYEFLTGERRTFEEKVAAEMAGLRLQDLQTGMAELADKNILGFTTVPYHGHEFPARITFDGELVSRDGHINVRVDSPLAALTTSIADLEDASLRREEQESIFILSQRVRSFDDDLRYFLAMKAVIDAWKGDPHQSEAALSLATQRESNDLKILRDKVLTNVQTGLRQATVVFRGSSRPIIPKPGQSASQALQEALAAFWPTLYGRYAKLPVTIVREQQAILDVLNGKNSSTDVQKLNLFDSAGQVDLNAPLIDALRVYLSTRQSQNIRTTGKEVIEEFTRPPYGWDPGAIRVGAAAMVRAGSVKVLINKRPFTNPADKQLQDAIRTSPEFNKVELVLEETDINPDVLVAVRKLLISLTRQRKIDETPAALAEVAGQLAANLLAQVAILNHWQMTAGLPLPVVITTAEDGLGRIQALTNPMHRVIEVAEQVDKLPHYQTAVQEAASFVEKYGQAFIRTREFASFLNGIIYRLTAQGAAATFHQNWQAAINQATIIDPTTWKGLQNDKAAAEIELQQVLSGWREAARQTAQSGLADLPDLLDKYNVAAADRDKIQDAVTRLQAFVLELDTMTEHSYLATVQSRSERYVQELRAQLETLKPAPPPPSPDKKEAVSVRLADYVADGKIAKLEQWQKLDTAVRRALHEGKEVNLT